MKGLSHDIKAALDTIIEGLDYRFNIEAVEQEDLKAALKAKLSSFDSAKKLLHQWKFSPNAPQNHTFVQYAQRIAASGDNSLDILRKALKQRINYKKIDKRKHYRIIETKTFFLDTIVELESSVIELKNMIEAGNIVLKEREFRRGFPEKYADGEFFPRSNYYKNWYNEEEDAIVIDPKGSRGSIIVLDDLRIQLPKPPLHKSKILFSDKKKVDQYWKREPMPPGLSIENADAFYDYIIEQFRRRREGVWFMNNGVPTYLTGKHWFQLQWGKMLDGGIYPNYREAQRDLAYHKAACMVDDRCMGQIFLKSRQTGYTYGSVSDAIEVATSTNNIKVGLTSMTEDDAKYAFAKEVYTFQELPFFFQPIVKGRADSVTRLEFGRPANVSKKSKKEKDTSTDGYLNTSTDYQATKEKAYDGQALALYIGDEAGKWKSISYIEHLNTLLPTIYRGGRVTGKCLIGSTIGKLSEGGEDFKTLYYASKVKNREESGKTSTKLYSYFIPAHKNFEAAIDKYGVCWEEKPPAGTRNTFGDPILKGSIDQIKDLYSEARKQGDAALNNTYRQFPMTENHAMRDEADQCVFNLTKLMDQYDHNDAHEIEGTKCSRGTFEWKDGARFSEVEWYPSENGRFNVWWMPNAVDGTKDLRNNVKLKNGRYYPMNDYGAIGVDSYGSYVQGNNKQSKGSAHCVSSMNLVGVVPHRFLFEYIDKPQTQDIFNEDILKAAWFYGLPILAENNRKDFVKYFYLTEPNSCRPFNLNRVDVIMKKLSGDDLVLGGQVMKSQDILNLHENAIRTYIQRYLGKKTEEHYRTDEEMGSMGFMPFQRTIYDWMKFDPARRTGFDATISSGLALVGANRHKYLPVPKKVDVQKTVSLLRKYDNSGDIGTLITR